jgi:alkylation response protein AidB-like acyl-CoA dehydrogenase
MDFQLDGSEEMLRDAARHFLGSRSNVQSLQLLEDGPTGFDHDAWATTVDLGWVGIAQAVDVGGSGGTIIDAAVIAKEIGRAAWPSPLLGCWSALAVLEHVGRSDLITRALSDTAPRVLLAPTEPEAAVTAHQGAAGWTLTASSTAVEWAEAASELVVVASAPDGQTLVSVIPSGAPGLEVRAARALDNERVALVRLDGAQAPAPTTTTASAGDVAAGIARGRLLRAAAMVGGAREVLRFTSEYMLQRRQFNTPLAGFQAVRHHSADMAIAVDGAELLVDQACSYLARGGAAPGLVAAAVLKAGQAYVTVVTTAAQLHGGVGVSVEHILPQHFRRAKAFQLRNGSERTQQQAVADTLVRRRTHTVMSPID